ncbi:MAG TPA: CBS domain-containing protein, partial [Solirubrobacteraceae bacterium]|nr:CBS domain-containing protein [Solirubrobacteraceae bacterium]
LDSGRFNADRSIASLVLRRPIVLAPGDPLLKAATVMTAEHIRRLPVIEDGSVVGMLARAKISRALLSEPPTPASA